jgi:ribonuclease BN (tRNA processing enzyme)
VSHLHGDHFGGLPFLVLDGQFSRRERPLVVAGPPGLTARVEAAMEVFFPGSTGVPRRFALEFVELLPRTPAIVGPATVTAFPVRHESGAPSYALRVTLGGRTIAYSGDTEWTETLIEAAEGADLFVCEAYFFDKAVKYHLDYATLQRHAARLTCRRIVLTHMAADMLARAGEAGFECAHDGLVVSV